MKSRELNTVVLILIYHNKQQEHTWHAKLWRWWQRCENHVFSSVKIKTLDFRAVAGPQENTQSWVKIFYKGFLISCENIGHKFGFTLAVTIKNLYLKKGNTQSLNV